MLFSTSDGLHLRMLDGNFAGFQEHKESLQVNVSLKSNGWNLEPKFNTCFCDVEIGGTSCRTSFISQHNQETTCIRESVIPEETEEEIEKHEDGNGVMKVSKPSKSEKRMELRNRKSGVTDKGNH